MGNSWIMLNNLLQIHLKTLQKEQFKKQKKQPVIWLAIKLLIKLPKSQEVYYNTVEIETENAAFDREIRK